MENDDYYKISDELLNFNLFRLKFAIQHFDWMISLSEEEMFWLAFEEYCLTLDE